MSNRFIACIVVIALSGVGALADALLKRSSLQPDPFASSWFGAGLLVYASTSFGWVYAMQRMNLAAIGAIYCVSTVLLLTTLGVVLFNETLNAAEVAGIGLAIASLILLSRFG